MNGSHTIFFTMGRRKNSLRHLL